MQRTFYIYLKRLDPADGFLCILVGAESSEAEISFSGGAEPGTRSSHYMSFLQKMIGRIPRMSFHGAFSANIGSVHSSGYRISGVLQPVVDIVGVCAYNRRPVLLTVPCLPENKPPRRPSAQCKALR